MAAAAAAPRRFRSASGRDASEPAGRRPRPGGNPARSARPRGRDRHAAHATPIGAGVLRGSMRMHSEAPGRAGGVRGGAAARSGRGRLHIEAGLGSSRHSSGSARPVPVRLAHLTRRNRLVRLVNP